MRLRISLSIAMLLCGSQLQAQEVRFSYPVEGGPITVESQENVETSGLEFQANGPFLSNGDDAAPFQFFLTGNNQSNVSRVTLGSLGTKVSLQGHITLDVHVSPGLNFSDLTGFWGRGTELVQMASFPGDPPLTPAVSGTWPAGGGTLTIEIGEDIVTGGMEFTSPGNTYLSNGPNAAPFQFFVTGNNKQDVASVVLGSLGTTTTLSAGSKLTLDIQVSEQATDFGDITVDWGRGAATFPTQLGPPTILPDTVWGTYPQGGGPISVNANHPVSILGMEFASSQNRLSNGNDPSPFESFLSGNNMSDVNRVRLSSSSSFVLDGTVTFDVFAGEDVQDMSGVLLSNGVSNSVVRTSFDINVVPEPASTGLVAVALVTLSRLRRTRRDAGLAN